MIHSTPSLGFLLLFFASKVTVTVTAQLFQFWMAHVMHQLSDDCLSFKSSLLIFFLRGRLCFNRRTTDKTWFFIIICHFTMNRKGSGIYVHFSTNFFIFKKASIKSDQYHVPVQRNRTISGLSVATWSRYMRRLQSDDWLW